MEPNQLLFIGFGFIASLVSAIFGLGTALLILAVGSHIVPPQEAIALATVLFTASTISKTLLYKNQINWKITVTMLIASLPFACLGATLMLQIPTERLKQFLGLMVLLHVFLPSPRNGGVLSTPILIAGSAVYGLISGLLGSGNIIKAMIFKQIQLSKGAFVGTMAATALFSNFAKLAVYKTSGLLGQQQALTIAGLVIVAVLAALTGRRVINTISNVFFVKGLNIILIISSIALLINFP